jgi:hypothetical protein
MAVANTLAYYNTSTMRLCHPRDKVREGDKDKERKSEGERE